MENFKSKLSKQRLMTVFQLKLCYLVETVWLRNIQQVDYFDLPTQRVTLLYKSAHTVYYRQPLHSNCSLVSIQPITQHYKQKTCLQSIQPPQRI